MSLPKWANLSEVANWNVKYWKGVLLCESVESIPATVYLHYVKQESLVLAHLSMLHVTMQSRSYLHPFLEPTVSEPLGPTNYF